MQPVDFLPPRGALIGMVHVAALPGTPAGGAPVESILERARADARALADAGFDAILIENMHDVPYVHGRQGPEIVACMTRAVLAVMDAAPSLLYGVQILSGGNHEALAVAHATGAAFIRCENFVFAHVADEGLLERAEAGPLLRYRRAIGAERVAIAADVKKKHAAHALTADLSIEDAAEAAAFFGADAIVVTGTATARHTDPDDVERAAHATTRPVLVGSGLTPDNAPRLLRKARGLIVGSWIKHEGDWRNPVDPARARRMAEAVRACRPSSP